MKAWACAWMAVVVAACGDNRAASVDAGVVDAAVVVDATVDAAVDAPTGDVAAQLAGLPGVTVQEVAGPAPFRYFNLRFTLPVDHDDPDGPTFELRGALVHRDTTAPLVVYTSGYDLGWPRDRYEPAEIVDGNQLSLEYRFYGASKPSPIPWPKLRLAQSAADEHAALALIGRVYRGKHLATGASKGGETALFHHYLYPDDYDGVIAYVAPLLPDGPDPRFAGGLDRIGIPACHDRLRALAREMLLRRGALESRIATDGETYTVVGIPRALESAVVDYEFWFWMTQGAPGCANLPAPQTLTDTSLYGVFAGGGGATASSDADLATWGWQYTYQAFTELGYPHTDYAYLADLMQYDYEDPTAWLPPGEPIAYDPTFVRGVIAWVEGRAPDVLLIYGEWDPWTDGAPTIAAGHGTHVYTVPHGSHWSTGIYSLPTADRAAATALVRGWAGLPASAALLDLAPPPAPLASNGPGTRLLKRR